MHVGLVQAPLERRVGQDHVEAADGELGELLRERVAQRVLVVDVGRLDAVEHQVHGGDAEHGRVEVVAVEQPALDVLAVRLQQVTREGLLAVVVDDEALG